MSISAVIVDDSLFTRSKMKEMLSGIPEVEVVGVAKNGEEAIDLIEEKQPRLVTLDNILPDMTGMEILQVLQPRMPETTFVMVSAVGQQSAVKEATLLGAKHYFVKPLDTAEFQNVMIKILNS